VSKSHQRILYRDDVSRFFFDTEFMEDGKTIELLSIGIVCDDGREYYAANREADVSKANPWVRENVLPHLPPKDSADWKSRIQIRDDVLAFVRAAPNRPQFWAYFADYDWVLFCQLFGRMIDLPQGFPMYCMDLIQLADALGKPKLPPHTGTHHNALDDARWNVKVFRFLRGVLSPGDSSTSDKPEQHLRALQQALPWGANTYSAAFDADPAPHKQYRHDVGHLMKTVGKLAETPFEMDHDLRAAAALREEDSKRLADLVIFALHMASTHPSGPIDLADAVTARLERTRRALAPIPVWIDNTADAADAKPAK